MVNMIALIISHHEIWLFIELSNKAINMSMIMLMQTLHGQCATRAPNKANHGFRSN